MTVPVKRVSGPELIGDPGGPYADSPEGWWTDYGGALDTRSGVVYFPPDSEAPRCSFPCALCQRGEAE